MAQKANSSDRKILSATLSKLAPTINITRTVGQILFEGYPDHLMKVANSMPFLPIENCPLGTNSRNGSVDYEGVFNMGTGKGTAFRKLYQWNYQTRSPYYQGNCGKVDGSAGDFLKPRPIDLNYDTFSSDL
ncbi:CD36 domain containing protein, partial [Asbolus verrucosus]